MTFEGFPLVIGLELTLECNIRCKHCASSAGQRRRGELTLDEIKRICDQFPDLLVQEVDITGGEPLVRPEWFDVAKYLGDLGIPVRLVTNGLLLENNISRLVQAKVATVGVSMDGLGGIHDMIRSYPGLFATLMKAIPKAVQAGIPVAVITSVNEMNIADLGMMRICLEDLGVKDWQVQPTFLMGRAREGKLGLSLASYLKLARFVRDHEPQPGSNSVTIMPADGMGYYTRLDLREKPWTGCGAGLSSCGITSDGKVKGCLSLPDAMIEGDLREQDLWDIWFDEQSFRYNRRFRQEELGKNCEGCSHADQCRGGCSVMSCAATGAFHNDPYCFYRLSMTGKKPVAGSPGIGKTVHG